ncbi:MAG: MFS transporter [Candidatus Bathyarchaeota archaeon]|nr:MFS transporter [Candidatus Bathyarchaeota archaeon]
MRAFGRHLRVFRLKYWASWLPNSLFTALNKDLKLIFVSNFIGAFGDGLYAYIWPLYIRELGADPSEVGVVFSVLFFVAALTPLPGGILADKYDRKKLMILGWLLWIPIPLVFSAAEHWTHMLPGAALYGIMLSGPATSAYIATVAHKKKMTQTFTLISAAWWLGYIFSPAIGGYLSSTVGMKWVFNLSFFFFVLATVLLLFISSQFTLSDSRREASGIPNRRRKILLWSAFFAAVFFVTILFRPYVPQFFQDVLFFDKFQIGILGSVTFLGSAILSVALGKLGDKWGKANAVFVSLILCFLALSFLVSLSNFFLLSFASFMIGASYPLWSLMGAVISSIAPSPSRGRWISVAQTMSLLAAFFAPYLGGLLYDSSPDKPFLIAIVATSILSVLALTKPLKDKN